jgi:hypothetical protein
VADKVEDDLPNEVRIDRPKNDWQTLPP